jgi:hypothetical protein
MKNVRKLLLHFLCYIDNIRYFFLNTYYVLMALSVMEFQVQGYKIRKIFAYKSTYPKVIIEFWELDKRRASVACKNQSF